jgi:polyphosphate kinase
MATARFDRTAAAARPTAGPTPDLHDLSLYTNRELSWLEFNQRVLDQAIGDHHPLLERVKFLAITGSNLDEFFMVRMATLLKKQRAGVDDLSLGGLSVSQELGAVRKRAMTLMKDQAACWQDSLRPALDRQGVRFLEPDDYPDAARRHLRAYFRTDIFPLLTPLAFDPGHPFPLISNRSKNFAVVVRHQGRTKFARVKVPDVLPRFVPIAPQRPGDDHPGFAFLEDVIRMNLDDLFPGVEVIGAHLFRIIRDTDIEVRHDGSDDLLESVDRGLKALRHGTPSLLQVEAAMPHRVLTTLVENFEVDEDIVVRSTERLGFADWMALLRLPLSRLKDTPFTPRTLWADSRHDPAVFEDLGQQDFLVHHPFHSFSAVETFLKQATTDPNVLAIKMTLYRIGAHSPLIDLLIEAAEAGKQVAVLVELQARFDERNNINWATRLESAGIHVVHGVENLKTHCKLCMVVRKEGDRVRRYAHIGTGNYNRLTSQLYTDLGLFTADPEILDDVAEVFNSLTGYSQRTEYMHLLVAPVGLRAGFLALIDREIEHAKAGRPAGIIIKNNAVTDPGIIRALYRASQHGVDIDMIVRGVCCLRTGLEGVSERIRVRSVVGRFLEHSRVYWFANGGDQEAYIGSADLMERNLDRRVEVLCPVRNRMIASHIRESILRAYLTDDDRAYVLEDDQYHRTARPAEQAPVSAQQILLDYYTSDSARTTASADDAS